MAAIHHAGIVHRDLKPSNVLLGPTGPRVVDFGISRTLDATVTLSGELLGSPAYMAPEQFAPGATSGLAIGPASDVWAWAAMTYAATGRPPFGRDTPAAVMRRVLSDPPDLGPMPDRLRETVVTCLAKAPADRPAARDVLERLGTEQSAPSPRQGRRRALLIALVVFAVIVGGVLAFLSFRTPGQNPRAEPNRSPSASPSTTLAAPVVRRPRAGPLDGTRRRLLADSDGPVALTAYSRRVTDFFGNPLYLWDPDAGGTRSSGTRSEPRSSPRTAAERPNSRGCGPVPHCG